MSYRPLEDDDTASYDGSEASTADTNNLDDLLARYTFTCNPEFCIKLRRRYEPLAEMKEIYIANMSKIGLLRNYARTGADKAY